MKLMGDADNTTELERNHGCLGTTYVEEEVWQKILRKLKKYQCDVFGILRTFKVQSLK